LGGIWVAWGVVRDVSAIGEVAGRVGGGRDEEWDEEEGKEKEREEWGEG